MNFGSWIRKVASGFSARGSGKHAKSKAGRGLRQKKGYRPFVDLLEDRTVLSVSILNGGGLGYAGSSGGSPPDETGAAGPSCYIETSNGNLAIFAPKATGTVLATANPDTFFFTTGGLTQITAGSQRVADVTSVYADQMGGTGRFVIGNIDISKTANVSQFVFAVSTSNNPTTFTTADWRFYAVTTTEGSGMTQAWTDYPGNPGFNADAFVVTFNMAQGGQLTNNTQIVSINAADLAAGNPLVLAGAGQNVFRNDIAGATNFRPVAMHDAVAGDPMWLIHDAGDGNNLDVRRMANVLSTTPTFTNTALALPAGRTFTTAGINDPLNPNSTTMNDVPRRILKAGEFNDTIVASQTVPVAPFSVITATIRVGGTPPAAMRGTGYAVGDVLTLTGGTGTAATLTVATLAGGTGVGTVTVTTAGTYTSLAGLNGTATGGGGSGAVFDFTFRGELDVQWYAINVGGAIPAFQLVGGNPNVGRIGFGPNTYAYEAGIDINSSGDIGLSFMQSDTVGGAANASTGGNPSTFVTARKATDPAGTMQPFVLVPAGTGTSGIGAGGTRIGDFSGLATDPVDGTFWATNQFGSGGGGPTAIANFLAAFGLDGTSENITIRVNPLDSTKIQILVTGTNVVVTTFANNSPILFFIQGTANNNEVIFDESFGVINTTIGFDGGGSAGAPGDRVIVVGSSGDDTLGVTATSASAADLSFDGSRTYSFRNIQQFSFNGMAGRDAMTVDSTTSLLGLSGGIQYDGGAGFNSLTLTQTGGTTRTSDTYSPGPGIGEGTSVILGGGITQSVSFQNLAPVFDLVPAATLFVSGTPDSNVINYTQGSLAARGKVTVDNFELIEFSNKTGLTINALVGNDIVNLNNTATPTGLTGITVNASDGDDIVTTLAGLPTALTLNGGDGHDVLSAAGTSGAATINGGTGNDTLIGGSAGDTLSGGDGEDTLDGRAGTNSLSGGAGTDTILVSGTSGPDTITTTHGAGSFTITGGLSAGTNNPISGMESVRVEGGDGADKITLNLLTAGGLNYTVLGGNPIGSPGDILQVNAAVSITLTATPGPENDAGSVDANTTTPTNVSYDEIELLILGGGGGVINGTNGPDAITIIARDGSTHGGADGVQDFTVSVNTGAEILFLNTPSLTVNALSGSDQVTLVTPAPNNAVWDVDVTVNGGAPAADTDRMIVQTPVAGAEAALYTPSAPDGGTLDISPLSSLLTLTGIEALTYDGQGDNDTLTVMATSAADTIIHTPGVNDQAGTFQVNTLLPISYQNLGATGALTVNGAGLADTLVYNGTAANDAFVVGAAGQINLNTRLVVNTANIEVLTMEGFAGDDTFTLVPAISVSPYPAINFNGGTQSSAAGDKTNLIDTAGADIVHVSGQVVTSAGKTVASSGVEEITLDLLAGTDELIYDGVVGVSEDINVIASTTAGGGQISVPNVTLVTFKGAELIDVNGNTPAPSDTDTLTFTGTNAVDVVAINLAADGTTSDPILKLQDAALATLLTLRNYTNFATLNVKTLDGEDIVNVFTDASGPSRNLFLDGGVPTGKKKSTDNLNIFYAPPRPRIIHSSETQDPDNGLVDLDYGTARFLIQYADFEQIVIRRA